MAEAPREKRIHIFEKILREHVEEILQQEQAVLESGGGQKIKVAHITFAFKNVPMIKLLQQRGTNITNASTLKIAEIDQKIKNMKELQIEELSKPVAAFITLETQEAFERACNLTGERNWKRQLISAKHTFLNDQFALAQAPEPTNIIWENRDLTFNTQLKRKGIVVSIIIILLLGAFFVFYILKR